MELKYTRRDLEPAARAFYERLAEGRFCIGSCAECGRRSYPPREFCRECGSDRYALVEHPGSGSLYAFTTQERGLRFTAPAVLGLVELDDGVGRGFGVIAGALEDLRIGQRVVLEPVTVEDGWVIPGWRAT